MRFRLAMHHRCEQSHGDLFVDTGNGDLITYDLPLEGLNRIIEMSVLGARFFLQSPIPAVESNRKVFPVGSHGPGVFADGELCRTTLIQRKAPVGLNNDKTPEGGNPPWYTHALQRKADHRRKYMTFEGELSGNRGSVETVLIGNLNFSFLPEVWPEKLWFTVYSE